MIRLERILLLQFLFTNVAVCDVKTKSKTRTKTQFYVPDHEEELKKARDQRVKDSKGNPIDLKNIPHVTEIATQQEFDAKIRDEATRNLVVVFYEPGFAECNKFRSILKELGRKVASIGVVEIATVICDATSGNKQFCKGEIGKHFEGRMQFTGYYGPGPDGRKPKKHTVESFAAMSKWIQDVTPDITTSLFDMGEVRSWLTTDEKLAKVLFFSDDEKLPPLLKGMSLSFRGRLAFGVIPDNAATEVATTFKVSKKPTLLQVVDTEALKVDRFLFSLTDKDDVMRFLTKQWNKHKDKMSSELGELTEASLASGDCAPSDGKFCVLWLHPPAPWTGSPTEAALKQLAQKVANDPVKVFVVGNSAFAKPFGLEPNANGNIVLFRPKRKRFKRFEGNPASAEDMAAFVDSAVNGGSPLPEQVTSNPTMHDEL